MDVDRILEVDQREIDEDMIATYQLDLPIVTQNHVQMGPFEPTWQIETAIQLILTKQYK